MKVAEDKDIVSGKRAPLNGVPEKYSRGQFVVDAGGAPQGLGGKLASIVQQQINDDAFRSFDRADMNARRAERKADSRRRRAISRQMAQEAAAHEYALINPYLKDESQWTAPNTDPHTILPRNRRRSWNPYETTQATYGAAVVGELVYQAVAPRMIPVTTTAPPPPAVLMPSDGGSTSLQRRAKSTHDSLPGHKLTLGFGFSSVDPVSAQAMAHLTGGALTAELLVDKAKAHAGDALAAYLTRDQSDDEHLARLGRTTSLVKAGLEHSRPSEEPTRVFLPGAALRTKGDGTMLKSFATVVMDGGGYVSPTACPGIPFADMQGPAGSASTRRSHVQKKNKHYRTMRGKQVITGDSDKGNFNEQHLVTHLSGSIGLASTLQAQPQQHDFISSTRPAPLQQQTRANVSSGLSALADAPVIVSQNRQVAPTAALSEPLAPAPALAGHPAHVSQHARMVRGFGGYVDRQRCEWVPERVDNLVSNHLAGAGRLAGSELFKSYIVAKLGAKAGPVPVGTGSLADQWGKGQELYRMGGLHSKQCTSPDNVLSGTGGGLLGIQSSLRK